MKDPVTQSKIQEIKELMNIWMKFYRLLSAGFNPETVTQELEEEFHQIKTIVAERHDHFMKLIQKVDDLHIGQSILMLVKRTISLKEFGKLSPVEINKISIEWHAANILLNETLGSMEYHLQKTIDLKAFDFYRDKYLKQIKRKFQEIQEGNTLKIAGVLIALAVVLYLALFPFYEKVKDLPKIGPYIQQLKSLIER